MTAHTYKHIVFWAFVNKSSHFFFWKYTTAEHCLNIHTPCPAPQNNELRAPYATTRKQLPAFRNPFGMRTTAERGRPKAEQWGGDAKFRLGQASMCSSLAKPLMPLRTTILPASA